MHSSHGFSKDTVLGPNTVSLRIHYSVQSREGQFKRRHAQPSPATRDARHNCSASRDNLEIVEIVKLTCEWQTDPIVGRLGSYPGPSKKIPGWPPVIEDDGLRPYAKHKTELSVHDGCILCRSRVVIPPPGHSQIISRMKSLARSYIWWPNMDQDVENKVKSCSECQINKKIDR